MGAGAGVLGGGADPMKRLGTAEDCVGGSIFLAWDSMSRCITGQIVDVNGGQLMV